MTFAARLLNLERTLYTRLRRRADARLAARALAQKQRPQPPHLLTGERGEDAAWFHLRSVGYTVVARRWTSPRLRGDLDLLAWDGDTLVVFEVKSRTARDAFAAEWQVDRDKRNQLRSLASAYLRRIPEQHRDSIPVRFDVLAVHLLPAGEQIAHFPNYFPHVAPPEDLPRRF